MDAHSRAQGLSVVGYYHANSGLGDTDLGLAARKVAERLPQQGGPARAVLVSVCAVCMHTLLTR